MCLKFSTTCAENLAEILCQILGRVRKLLCPNCRIHIRGLCEREMPSDSKIDYLTLGYTDHTDG
jgi:hypothetical protein